MMPPASVRAIRRGTPLWCGSPDKVSTSGRPAASIPPVAAMNVWPSARMSRWFVSCADVKYGVSRTFATDRITGGSQYALQLLDIPSTTDAQGRVVSAYKGPYSGVGQALYDKAVTCDGQEITFHLKTPRFDFDQIVSLPAFAPARQDQDTDRTKRDPLSVFA